MKTICCIPVKEKSKRLPGKNFMLIGEKPMYVHVLSSILEANCYDRVCVDTDSERIKESCRKTNITVIDRLPEHSEDSAHGNQILYRDYELYPDYDLYFQMHITCPFLKSGTIKACVEFLKEHVEKYDSIFTVVQQHPHIWMYDQPLFRIDVDPRTQDSLHLFRETSGIFGTTKANLQRFRSRVGRRPYKFMIDDIEAIDIDTELDYLYANVVYDKLIEPDE